MDMQTLVPWSRPTHPVSGNMPETRDPFMSLHREMNRLFDDVLRGFDGSNGLPGSWPSMEVKDEDDQVLVVAELPGLKEKDVELMIRDGALTLRGERKSETEDTDRRISERFYGRFERRIPLGHDIDEDNVTAEFKDGELIVTLPKMAGDNPGSRRIEISSHS